MGWAAGRDTAAGTSAAGGTGEPDQPPELVRLRSLWGGVHSITCLDGTWNAYYVRTAEEFEARSLRELGTKIRQDYARRVDNRPGAPERMST
jgi:hypothetical protein